MVNKPQPTTTSQPFLYQPALQLRKKQNALPPPTKNMDALEYAALYLGQSHMLNKLLPLSGYSIIQLPTLELHSQKDSLFSKALTLVIPFSSSRFLLHPLQQLPKHWKASMQFNLILLLSIYSDHETSLSWTQPTFYTDSSYLFELFYVTIQILFLGDSPLGQRSIQPPKSNAACCPCKHGVRQLYGANFKYSFI